MTTLILVGAICLFMAAAVLISTRIDSVYVKPRMSGRSTSAPIDRPCIPKPKGDWKKLTQTWLLHRFLAFLVIVVSVVILVATLAFIALGSINEVAAGLVAATTTAIGGFYLARFPTTVAFLMNPPFDVGDVVGLAEEFESSPNAIHYYYVMDVAMEGFKLAACTVDAPTAELATPIGIARDETFDGSPHDRILDISQVNALLRTRTRAKPCQSVDRCSGVNPYCEDRTKRREGGRGPVTA